MPAARHANGLSGARTLVTGGTGYLGSHLVEYLVEAGAVVHVVSRSAPGPNLVACADRFTHREVVLQRDPLEPIFDEGPFDLVFHLAGQVEVPRSVDAPLLDLESNATLTLRLLEAIARGAPEARLVFASTVAVYGDAGDGVFAESGACEPVSPYGASKWLAERYVAQHAAARGGRAATARLFSTFGPRLRKHVVHDLMRKLAADPNELRVQGDGRQVRDFLYVRDVVRALVHLACEAPARGEVYNVASGEPISIGDLARAIAEAMTLTPEIVFGEPEAAGVAQRWRADVSRLHALGFRPEWSLRSGLAETVDWFRRQLDHA